MTYEELLSDDPAWPALAAAASRRAVVLPREATAARTCLETLQVTTRSTLGALAHETGGLLMHHGWLRLFGCGHAKLPRVLGAWNRALGVSISDYLFIGDDVLGGAFAIDGGALGARGSVHYFAPDTLAWEDLGVGHSAFVSWALGGDLATFAASRRWSGWEREIANLDGDHVVAQYPPPWTTEGKNVAEVSRRAIPAIDHWRLQQELVAKMS